MRLTYLEMIGNLCFRCIILTLIVSTFSVTVLATSIPRSAPVNPAFTEFMEQGGLPVTSTFRQFTEKGISTMVISEEYYFGFIPAPVDLSHTAGLTAGLSVRLHPQGSFPSSYDLRTQDRLTAIRDQGNCGSCWTFATYGSLESWLRGQGEIWDLSENNLKECHGFNWGPCSGGNPFLSTAYLARRSGPIREADDPYVDHPTGCTSGLTVYKHLENVLMPPDRVSPLDNDTLKQAIMDYGAVGTTMYYNGAYYNSADYTYYYPGTHASNHAVALVGWDDDKVVSGAPGAGAWIVRNSWGTAWGEQGYFYISYYDSRIGTINAVFINAQDPIDSTMYQYDPLGFITSWGYGTTTAWGANVFTPSKDGVVTAVGTYAVTVNTAYELYIKQSGPNGTLLHSQGGTLAFPGYHTIKLTSPASFSSSDTFSVVIKFTTPGYIYPLPAEQAWPGYSDAATANPGESYVSSNGSSWADITDYESTCNFCIKAIVVANLPPEVELNTPSGAQIWKGTEKIKWEATDPNDSKDSLKITLSYSSDNGITWNTVITDTENDGAYSWDTTKAANGECKVKILVEDPGGLTAEGVSDTFTINNVLLDIALITHGPNPVLPVGCIFWLDLPDDTLAATVKIFDIDGAELLDICLDPTADRYPQTGLWLPQDDQGRLLGTGLYLYVVEIRHTDGTTTYSSLHKMVINQ